MGLIGRNLGRVRREAATRGAWPVLRACAAWGPRWAAGRAGAGGRGSFSYAGRRHSLFRHPYHYTWLNERAVEVPIFRALVDEQAPEGVLEVGNVLSHYGPVEHEVIDRYERAPGVLNEDVLEFRPDRRYELIVSISTLEHVGRDEEPRDPTKALRAIEHLRALLAPGGRLVFSVPVGYNAELDRALADDSLPLSECRALRRERGRWREVAVSQALGARYDELLYEAGAVVIGTVGDN